MAFVPKAATAKNWHLRLFAKKASTTYTAGSVLAWTNSADGNLTLATATSTKLVGICQQTVSSGDATTSDIPVLVPIAGANSEVIALTASAVTTDVGGMMDLSDDKTVNRGANAVRIFICTGFISATSIIGYFLLPALTATT